MPHNLSYLTRSGNINLGNAQLAEGTNANTIKTVQAIDYLISGLLYSKAATDNIAMTAAAVQAAGTTAVYLITIDVNGTVTITKGDQATIGQGTVLKWPAAPAASAVIGGFKLKNTTNPFTSGTTDLSAAGVTATFYNFAAYPEHSITA